MKSIYPASWLAMIALVITTLVACGGSDTQVKIATTDLPAIHLSPANASLAKAVGAALVGKSISLTSSDGFLNGDNSPITNFPASTLSFSALPADAPSNAIASVTLANEYYRATGYVFPGSLNIFINNFIWLGTPNPSLWTPPVFTVGPILSALNVSFFSPVFSVDFNTSGLFLGQQSLSGNIVIGPYGTVTTFPVNVSENNNTVSLSVGDAALTVDKVDATGATGSTGASGSLN